MTRPDPRDEDRVELQTLRFVSRQHAHVVDIQVVARINGGPIEPLVAWEVELALALIQVLVVPPVRVEIARRLERGLDGA